MRALSQSAGAGGCYLRVLGQEGIISQCWDRRTLSHSAGSGGHYLTVLVWAFAINLQIFFAALS